MMSRWPGWRKVERERGVWLAVSSTFCGRYKCLLTLICVACCRFFSRATRCFLKPVNLQYHRHESNRSGTITTLQTHTEHNLQSLQLTWCQLLWSLKRLLPSQSMYSWIMKGLEPLETIEKVNHCRLDDLRAPAAHITCTVYFIEIKKNVLQCICWLAHSCTMSTPNLSQKTVVIH